MKRNKNIVLITIFIVTLAAAIGITIAYMFKKSEVTNHFNPAQVSCRVHEKLDDIEHTDGINIGSKKSDITVENTGNITSYLRVRLVSYWVDEKGDVVGEPSKMPTINYDQSNWIAGSDNTYYYKKPVDAGEQTAILCDAFTLEQKIDSDSDTLYQVVEVFAEAVQANPQDAVEAAWKVTLVNSQIEVAP